MRKFLIAIAACAALAGCAGTKFDFEAARQVKVGMTEAEVQELMGRPYSVTTKGDSQIWVWSYANGMTGAHQAVSFVMKDGKVESVPKIPESFK